MKRIPPIRRVQIALGMFSVNLFVLLSFGSAAVASVAQGQQSERRLGVHPVGQMAERRVALVIGNGAYTAAPTLRNPPNDAREMAATLRSLGFDVSSAIDAGQRQMKQLIREFGQRLKGGAVGVFYYAGHGVQSKGRNYLIPVDADIQSETDVEDLSVDVNLVLGLMDEAGNGLNIVILDACRNNPFARSFRSATNGLAQMSAPTGTLIAYATAPGSVASDGDGRNGLYTAELLKQMREPGVPIEIVFKRVGTRVSAATSGRQEPWIALSLRGDFYFLSAKELARESAPQTNVPSVDLATVELAFWETIKNSSNPQDFQAYLREYPNGRFASLARIRVSGQSSVDKPPESNPVASDSISGRYEGVAKGGMNGDIPTTLELRNDAGRLSGKVETPQGPCKITSGSYTNGKLILKLDASGSELTFNIQINGSRMVGEWELLGTKGTLDLKKVSN